MVIRVMFSIIPGALALINGIVLCFLALDEKTIKQVREKLADARKLGEESEEAGASNS